MTIPSKTPLPIESFLPSPSSLYSITQLVQAYARWWCSLPSVTPYERYFTGNQNDLVVWEGYPGWYDSYGDFGDDDVFYNDIVKGFYRHWYIYQTSNGLIKISNLDLPPLSLLEPKNWKMIVESMFTSLRRSEFVHGPSTMTYANLVQVRWDMIHRWGDGNPTLGEQGQALATLAATYAQPVFDLLERYGMQWVAGDKNRHYLVYRHDHYTYLALWMGESDAVRRNNITGQPNGGCPIVWWDKGLHYVDVRIGFKRIPIRFSVEVSNKREDQFYYGGLMPDVKTFDLLQQGLASAFANIRLYGE